MQISGQEADQGDRVTLPVFFCPPFNPACPMVMKQQFEAAMAHRRADALAAP